MAVIDLLPSARDSARVSAAFCASWPILGSMGSQILDWGRLVASPLKVNLVVNRYQHLLTSYYWAALGSTLRSAGSSWMVHDSMTAGGIFCARREGLHNSNNASEEPGRHTQL